MNEVTREVRGDQKRETEKNDDDDVFAWTERLTVVDYEKELMKKRAQLLYKLKDPIIYQEFVDFMSFSKSSRFVLCLNCVYSLVLLPPVVANLLLGSREVVVMSVLETVLTILMVLAGWLVYGCMREGSLVQSHARFLLAITGTKSWKEVSNQIQGLLYFLLVGSMGLVMIRRSWVGECRNSGYWTLWTCNPSAASHGLPMDSTVILAAIPVLFSCVMRETRVILTLLAWSMTIFCLIFCCALVHSTNSCIVVLFYGIASSIVMFDSYKQCLLFYLLSRQLKKTIETNQRLADENKASELRHMIANVAHDLKTPLSSFMTGIDLIAADLSDLEQKLSSVTPRCGSSVPISSFISAVHSNIINIRNTNSFMLMTINRCLDYTKASNGLKLVPKNETIDLNETLMMPLHCMINIQQKIKITLVPFNDQDICSHIITDKQWLQENVLCLLSNAVKYSAGGEVMIKVTRISCAESIKLRKKEYSSFTRDKESKDQSTYCDANDDVESGLRRDCRRQITAQSRNLQRIVPITSDIDLSETSSNLDDCDCNSCKSKKTIKMMPESFIYEEAMVEVVDAGIGLSEEAMKTLFNPFQQTQRLAGGTGLGLYSLAKRIESLRGTYGVRQRNDGKQGSVFWFTIPYKADKLTALHHQLPSKDKLVTRVRLNNENSPPQIVRSMNLIEEGQMLRLLLAEDTPSIAKMMTLLLRRQHHETVVAENGQIALDMLYKANNEQRYDVVLMDLQMPVMDGLEATRRIRAREQSKGGPRQVIIGISANSDHETMEEAFEAGIDDFLPKPFTVEAFMKVVRRAQLQCDEKTQVLYSI